MPLDQRGEAVFVEDIAFHRCHARQMSDLFRAAGYRGYRVAATGEFLEKARADLAGCADEGDLHGEVPFCLGRRSGQAAWRWATRLS